MQRIKGNDDPLARQLRQNLRRGCGPENDSAGTGIEPVPCRVDVPDTATDTAGRDAHEFLDEGAVVAGAACGVEVDDGDLAGQAETLGDWPGIACLDAWLPAADKLHGLAVRQVNRRHDHVCDPWVCSGTGRVGMPAPVMACLTSPTV